MWHNLFVRLRRRLLVVGAILFALAASTVRIRVVKLGWGGYWAIEFVAPWHTGADK